MYIYCARNRVAAGLGRAMRRNTTCYSITTEGELHRIDGTRVSDIDEFFEDRWEVLYD